MFTVTKKESAEVRAARKFGVSLEVIEEKSRTLWKGALTEERDRRAEPLGVDKLPERSRWAVLANITRHQLYPELEREIKNRPPTS
jgi:hypothetical protein